MYWEKCMDMLRPNSCTFYIYVCPLSRYDVISKQTKLTVHRITERSTCRIRTHKLKAHAYVKNLRPSTNNMSAGSPCSCSSRIMPKHS